MREMISVKKYLDKTLEAKERARLLLEEMSLDEKMAQINVTVQVVFFFFVY